MSRYIEFTSNTSFSSDVAHPAVAAAVDPYVLAVSRAWHEKTNGGVDPYVHTELRMADLFMRVAKARGFHGRLLGTIDGEPDIIHGIRNFTPAYALTQGDDIARIWLSEAAFYKRADLGLAALSPASSEQDVPEAALYNRRGVVTSITIVHGQGEDDKRVVHNRQDLQAIDRAVCGPFVSCSAIDNKCFLKGARDFKNILTFANDPDDEPAQQTFKDMQQAQNRFRTLLEGIAQISGVDPEQRSITPENLVAFVVQKQRDDWPRCSN